MKIPEIFEKMRDRRLVFDMDIEFALFVSELAEKNCGMNAENIFSAAVFASNSVLRGKNICLDLGRLAGKSYLEYFIISGDETALEEDQTDIEKHCFPPLEKWTEELEKSGICGKPGDFKILIADAKNRLYLYKYFLAEKSLAEKIIGKIKEKNHEVSSERLKELLDKYFPAQNQAEVPDLQRLSAFMAVRSNFTLISGGPGTGKTTTASKILAILYELSGGSGAPVVLAAPTGKAASRLSESISRIKSSPDFPDAIKNAMPEKAHTVHRLLGVVPGEAGFIHNAENPLDAETIVIDEASMISLPLMSRLMDAVSENTRIIMLGDKDQLSSVEAGSVLADLCDIFEMEKFSHATAKLYQETGGGRIQESDGAGRISDAAVLLKKSMRFKDSGGIGGLASAVNNGNTAKAFAILKSGTPELTMEGLPSKKDLEAKAAAFISKIYEKMVSAPNPADALKIFNTFRILCARKSGPYGADTINSLIEKSLGHEAGTFYHGRPIMILKNDYGTGLLNGDIGIMWNNAGTLAAAFPDKDNKIKTLIPGMLPAHETAFAMTIHKSQGSEFDSVLLVMPEKESPLLTRELLYTGITRAKTGVGIWGGEKTISHAIESRTFRDSGLRDMLSSGQEPEPPSP